MRRQLLGLCALALFVVGCYPKNVLWTPDSKSIIVAENEDTRLVQLEVESGARRLILSDAGARTPWPALSPDGKRLAVARIERSSEAGGFSRKLRTIVIVFDLHGNEVKRSSERTSEERTSEPLPKETSLEESFVLWSTTEDKVVVPGGIYDFKSKQWIPIDLIPIPWNNGAGRPDGKGFLASNPRDPKQFLHFVDWQGWSSEIKYIDRQKVDAFFGLNWSKNLCVIFTNNGKLEIDTDSLVCRQAPWAPPKLDEPVEGGSLLFGHVFATGMQVFVVGTSDESVPRRLEAVSADRSRRRLLVEPGRYRFNMFGFFPSPDGHKCAIRTRTIDNGKEVVLVVEDTGVIAKSIDLESDK